jgi:hypothetical protein
VTGALFGLLLAIQAGSGAPWTDNYNRPGDPSVPQDVRPVVIQRQACEHFSSEPQGDEPERDALLNRMIAETCGDLLQKQKALLERYRDRPELRVWILGQQ